MHPWGFRSTPGASDAPLEPQTLGRQIHPWSLRSTVQPQIDSPLSLEPQIHPWSLRSTPGASDPWGSTPEPQIHPWSRFHMIAAPGGTLAAVERTTRGRGPRWYAFHVPCYLLVGVCAVDRKFHEM